MLTVLIHIAVQAERDREIEHLQAHVSQFAVTRVAQLQVELYANIFLAAGLTAYINTGNQVNAEKMEQALKSVYRLGRHIRNIGLAPGNRITYVYPLEGNESAIGLYYPDMPTQWPAVKKVIDTRESILAGPLQLKQGGWALINRTPVFLDNGEYWGILSLVLDTDSLMTAAGFNDRNTGIELALRGKDAAGEDGEVFFGDAALFETDSTRLFIPVPGGSWQLAARPVAGWNPSYTKFVLLESVGVAVVFFLTLLQLKYHSGMARLAENECRLRVFLNTAQDGVVVISEKGTIIEYNPAAQTLFEYSPQEALGQSVNMLISDGVAAVHDLFAKHPNQAQSCNMAPSREVMGRRKDGAQFPVAITIGRAYIGKDDMFVVVIRGISERKSFA